MADYRPNPSGQEGLMAALAKLQEANQFQQAQKQRQDLQTQALQGEAERQQAGFTQQKEMVPITEQSKLRTHQGESDIDLTASRERLADVLKNSKNVPAGSGLSEAKEGASFTKPTNMGVYDFKKQQLDQSQANKYAKGLEKYSDLSGAASDLERITNRDGKGGVFTNPGAALVSGGKVASATPDAAMGLAELVGMASPGSAEERKALARYKLAMGHALTGARMNPTMQKIIQDSLGGMASGDPQLMAKGLRGSARIIGGTLHTVQGGFTPEVRGQVHEQMGMDPMELFGKVPPENEPPSNLNSPLPKDPQNVQPVQPPAQQPPKQSPQQRMQYLMDKKAGKIK